ncbi:MAG TPA: RNA polymerase sigma factor [Thiothrix sp.]|nr:RNA polymerase sigma factor [Thiothrix sp.]
MDDCLDRFLDEKVMQSKEWHLKTTNNVETFLHAVERKAFVIARMNTDDDEEALDLVQEAMFTLVRKYKDRPAEELPPLFHTILYSKINDWHRKQKVRNRWRVFFNQNNDSDNSTDIESSVPQVLFSEPDKEMQQQEETLRITALIKQLPPRQQQALVLRAWEGYNVAETAKIMKCSEGSVKTHYSRAVHSLRAHLASHDVESRDASSRN